MAIDAKKTLIVGMGVSGLSVARYLARNDSQFEIADTKSELPESLYKQEPSIAGVRFHGGGPTAALLKGFDRVVVSPGVPTRTAEFAEARGAGVEVVGDIELFALATGKPILAVTGSNGKSTVVTLLGSLLRAAQLRVSVIGNVGFACLDGLSDETTDIYVLELSSFQLETTCSLQPLVGCVLNVSEDHLDRYDGLDDYASTKCSIYANAKYRVYNADDTRTLPDHVDRKFDCGFSAHNDKADWYLNHGEAITFCGPDNLVIDSSLLRVAGGHNRCNALAAMAMASFVLDDLDVDPVEVFKAGLAGFNGLAHRTERVAEIAGVSWINDSKGTNVGACISAINGMHGPVILIAGGRGKNADYTPMRSVVRDQCRAVILIGEDAQKIHRAIGGDVSVYFESSMSSAVKRAAKVALSGDCVLLSPACASFDMFENFEARGFAFAEEVRKLCA